VALSHLQQVNLGPHELPPTSPLDLRRAWRAAHVSAEVGITLEPGDVAGIHFVPQDGDEIRFLFADLDAACWAAAIDRTYGLQTVNGVSLLFRLLALINLMSEARWLQPFFSLSGKDGATLEPALLYAASTEPLSRAATFESTSFKRALGLDEAPKVRSHTAIDKSPRNKKAAASRQRPKGAKPKKR
jgi:hypothetical protein